MSTPVTPSSFTPAPAQAAHGVTGRMDNEAENVSRLAFGRLLTVEVRKLVDTAACRWLLGVIVALTVAMMLLVWFFSDAEGRTFAGFFGAALIPQGVLLPVLGILAATQEGTHRTGLVTFTHEPRRVRVALAKALAAVVLGVMGLAAGAVVAAVFTGAAVAVGDVDHAWTMQGWVLAGHIVSQLIGVLAGVAFGLLIPITWIAIVAYFMLPIVITTLGVLVERFASVTAWVDLTAASEPLSKNEALTSEQVQHLVSALGVWVVLPFVVGTILLVRREVK